MVSFVAGNEYDDYLDDAAQKAGVHPLMLKSIWFNESRGKTVQPDPTPGTSEYDAWVANDKPSGPFQITEGTARQLGIKDRYDLLDSMYGAARYLREGLDHTGTPQGALAYYFGGPDTRGWGPKTAAYVQQATAVAPALGINVEAAGSLRGGPMARKPVTSQPPAQPPAQPHQDEDPDVAAGQALVDQLTSGKAASPTPAEQAPAVTNPSHAQDDDVAEGQALVDQLTKPEQPALATPAPSSTPGDPAVASAQQTEVPVSQGVPGPAENPSLPLADVRSKLMGDPNYTYGTVLPLRKNNDTGKLEMAVPMMLRDPLIGGIDMANSVQTGVVTPQNTLALAGVLAGNPRTFGLKFNGAAADPILSQEFRKNPFGVTGEGTQIPASAVNETAPRGPVSVNPNVTKTFDEYIELAQKAAKEGGSEANTQGRSFANRLMDATLPSVAGKAAFVGAGILGMPAHVADIMAQSGTRMLLERLRNAAPGSAEAAEARTGLHQILSKAVNDQVKAAGRAVGTVGAGAGAVEALTPDQIKTMRTLGYKVPEA